MSGWCLGFLFLASPHSSSSSPSTPSLFINDLSLSNITLAFHLGLKNENNDKGVYYDNITLSFFFPANSPRTLGPDVTFPAFYQGHGKKANRYESVPADGGNLLPNGKAAEFEDEGVRYKISGFKTASHVKLHGEVRADEQGKKVGKKGVELRSAGTPRRRLPAAAGFAAVEFEDKGVRYKISGFKTASHVKLHGEVRVDEQGKKVGKKGVELRSVGTPRRRLGAAAGFAALIFTAIFLAIEIWNSFHVLC